MKAQLKKNIYPFVLLLLVIIAYNSWSFCYGHCTTSSLLSLSPPALILLAGIAVALVVLGFIKNRNRQRLQLRTCACGMELRSQWDFCPTCGLQRKR